MLRRDHHRFETVEVVAVDLVNVGDAFGVDWPDDEMRCLRRLRWLGHLSCGDEQREYALAQGIAAAAQRRKQLRRVIGASRCPSSH
ncbi:hypothetical protein A2J03_17490 [Rhodococcus sp. EPR-157]|nr:hypothetical protein A2J03_17490 [Rhodococcus sp. EPR-157]